MMKRFLTTTALIALVSAPAMAASTDTEESAQRAATPESAVEATEAPAQNAARSSAVAPAVTGEEMSVNDFIGASVYVTAEDGTRESVGEVADALVSRKGELRSALIDVGGFLGVGEKRVALDMGALDISRDENGDLLITTSLTAEQLKAAPIYNAKVMANQSLVARSDADPDVVKETMEAIDAAEAPDAAVAPKAGGEPRTAETPNTTMAPLPDDAAPMDSSTDSAATEMAGTETAAAEVWTEIDPAKVSPEKLQGADVYDVNDEDIGEVDRIVGADGETQAVIDVGGFLGFGEKPVLVPLSELRVMQSPDGDEVTVHIARTGEALGEAPAYKG